MDGDVGENDMDGKMVGTQPWVRAWWDMASDMWGHGHGQCHGGNLQADAGFEGVEGSWQGLFPC